MGHQVSSSLGQAQHVNSQGSAAKKPSLSPAHAQGSPFPRSLLTPGPGWTPTLAKAFGPPQPKEQHRNEKCRLQREAQSPGSAWESTPLVLVAKRLQTGHRKRGLKVPNRFP